MIFLICNIPFLLPDDSGTVGLLRTGILFDYMNPAFRRFDAAHLDSG